MLRVIAKRTGYCDGFDNLRVDKVSVATFAASVDEARSHKVVNKLSYFWRHFVTLCSSIAKLLSILWGDSCACSITCQRPPSHGMRDSQALIPSVSPVSRG